MVPSREVEVHPFGEGDYGMCEDMVSIPTFDLYRNNRENIKDCGEWFCVFGISHACKMREEIFSIGITGNTLD